MTSVEADDTMTLLLTVRRYRPTPTIKTTDIRYSRPPVVSAGGQGEAAAGTRRDDARRIRLGLARGHSRCRPS